MKPIEESLWALISKQDLPAVKALLKIFDRPHDYFDSISEYPSLSAVNEQNESFFLHVLDCGNAEMVHHFFTPVNLSHSVKDPIDLPDSVKDLVTTQGDTLLGKAAEKGYVKVAELLLKKGVIKNKAGTRTPMSIAAQHGQIEILRLLMRAEVNINLPENNGNYPLHCAAFHNQLAAARLLLESGAQCALLNNNGESALDMASIRNHAEMVFLLLTYGAGIAAKFSENKKTLYDQVNVLINAHPHRIILIGSNGCHFFPNAITSFEQFRALSFETIAQRESFKIACQLKLTDQSISEKNLDQIHTLLQQISLPDLRDIAAQYIRLNVNTVISKTPRKIKSMGLPLELVTDYALQSYVDELVAQGLIAAPISQSNVLMPAQMVPYKKMRERIKDGDLPLSVSSQHNQQIKKLSELQQSIKTYSEALKYHEIFYRVSLNVLIAVVTIGIAAGLFAYSGDVLNADDSNTMNATGYVAAFGMLSAIFLVPAAGGLSLYLFCHYGRIPLNEQLKNSRDILIARLTILANYFREQNYDDLLANLQPIIAALSAPNNYRNEIIVEQLDRLKEFVSTEQTRINDLESQRVVPYVSFALSFFPPPDNARQILGRNQIQDATANEEQVPLIAFGSIHPIYGT